MPSWFSPTIFHFQRSGHTKRTLSASRFNENFGTLSHDRGPVGSQEFVGDDLRFYGRLHERQVVYFVHSGTPTITGARNYETPDTMIQTNDSDGVNHPMTD
ncbi:unnamed protein product [Echinostoma caproni]|uniref:YDG domain-containing protein n=1 Tax=Echinostoma caproni TaxID=27848 RepID=A0A183BGR0_9TREM|nr:unnamed protein product [Echinostoma caproni]